MRHQGSVLGRDSRESEGLHEGVLSAVRIVHFFIRSCCFKMTICKRRDMGTAFIDQGCPQAEEEQALACITQQQSTNSPSSTAVAGH